MTTGATTSQGVQLKRGDGAGSETFTLIGELLSFDGPEESVANIDVTNFQSTSREYIAGLRDGGEVSMDLNYVSSNVQQQGLRTDLAAGTVRNFQLELNDMPSGGATNTIISFSAIVMSWSISGAVDNQIQASCTLKVSGDVTYVVAT